jgi:hypothetical protein
MDPVRICVLTPVYGDPQKATVSARYAGALYALSNDLDVMCSESHWRGPTITIEPTGFHSTDVVIARSELVKKFLAFEPRYTHALWWDEDVVGTTSQITKLIVDMVHLGRPAVGVPYPQKRLDFEHAARALQREMTFKDARITAEELEALCTPHYAYNLVEDSLLTDGQDCADVPFMPLGFSLWSREAFETMTAYYESSLSYRRWTYDAAGRAVLADDSTVALFALRHTPGGELDSEDFSFCSRYTAIGGKLALYVGEGSPLSHLGAHVFRGSPLAVRRC